MNNHFQLDFQHDFVVHYTASSVRFSNKQITHWKNMVLHFKLSRDMFPLYEVFGVGESLLKHHTIPFFIKGTLCINGSFQFVKQHISKVASNQVSYSCKLSKDIREITAQGEDAKCQLLCEKIVIVV